MIAVETPLRPRVPATCPLLLEDLLLMGPQELEALDDGDAATVPYVCQQRDDLRLVESL